MQQLRIPDNTADLELVAAALAYTALGWYVVPLAPKSKHPGSILGKSWHTKSVNSKDGVLEHFFGLPSDAGIALHAGRSGAVIFDVDNPDKIPDVLAPHLENCPLQTTRANDNLRGHYVFAQPADRRIGNGLGKIPPGWGDVRGHNGIIVAAPSLHPHPDGQYQWVRSGDVPILPGELADLLTDATPTESAATDAQVRGFLERYHVDIGTNPGALTALARNYQAVVSRGDARHHRMTSSLAGAFREAAAGLYSARTAHETLRQLWMETSTKPGVGDQGAARTPQEADIEWQGMVAWAVGQATTADLEDTVRRATAATVQPTSLVPAFAAPPAPALTVVPPVDDTAPTTAEPVPTTDVDEPPAAEEASPPPEPLPWKPVDLAAIFHNGIKRPPAIYGHRIDGQRLFYAAKVNTIIGPSESGKTWVAYQAVVDAIRRGAGAVIVDCEDSAETYAERMLALQLTPDEVITNSRYIAAETRLDQPNWVELATAIDDMTRDEHPPLVIIDGIGMCMSLWGLNPLSNEDAATFQHLFLKPLAKTGACVVILDHTGKNQTSKGAIGAQAKRAFLTGCGIHVEPLTAFGIGKTGYSKITVDKDRPGRVRGAVVSDADHDSTFGWATFSSCAETETITVTIETQEPVLAAIKNASESPQVKAEKIVLETLKNNSEPLSKSALRKAVGGRAITADAAVKTLAARGEITSSKGPTGHLKWSLASNSSQLVPTRPDELSNQTRPSGPLGGARDEFRSRADKNKVVRRDGTSFRSGNQACCPKPTPTTTEHGTFCTICGQEQQPHPQNPPQTTHSAPKTPKPNPNHPTGGDNPT